MSAMGEEACGSGMVIVVRWEKLPRARRQMRLGDEESKKCDPVIGFLVDSLNCQLHHILQTVIW